MWKIVWLMSLVYNSHDGLEPTDRLVPPGWQGNPWGPEATKARQTGEIPPVPLTPVMKQWDRWGKQVLRDGDVLFRRGDAKLLRGHFPFSRFIANISGSQFSHTGIAAIEGGEPVVYDTTKAGVRRQPFCVWILDNAGPFGVKRVKPERQAYAARAVAYCRDLYAKQVPFDYELSIDDKALYCVEMTEKAYRNNGLPLAPPQRLGDMENITKFPICVMAFMKISDLQPEQLVFFPGNERHGIWSSPHLMTVYAPPPTPPKPAARTASGAAPGAPAPAARPTTSARQEPAPPGQNPGTRVVGRAND
jgi:hypothetical protein